MTVVSERRETVADFVAQVRRAILRIHDRQQLLEEACRMVVDLGGFRMAWIGWVDESGDIVPVASSGHVDGYLDDIRITTHGTTGQGPSGAAALTGQTQVCQDIASDPVMLPWRNQAAQRGYRSSAAFPLRNNGTLAGVLSVYAEIPSAFDAETVLALTDLAGDLATTLILRDEQEARLTAERRYRELVERAAEGIFHTGVDGQIIDANPAMASILGYVSARELMQSVVHAKDLYVDPSQRDEMLALLRAKGEVHDFHVEQRRKDGRSVWLSVTARLLFDDEGEPSGLEGLAVDISPRKRSERELRQRDGILGAVSNLAEVLLGQGQSWGDALETQLGRLATAAGADRAAILEVYTNDDGDSAIRRTVAWATNGVDPLIGDPRLEGLAYQAAGYGPWADALAAGDVLNIRTAELPDEQRGLLEALGSRTLLFAPIHVDGEWWGTINLETVVADHEWSDIEADALGAAARVLGAAIAHDRALLELRERDQRLVEIMEAVPVGIVFVDDEGTINYANAQAEHILRLDRGRMAGRTYDDPAWRITSLDGGAFPPDRLVFAQVATTLSVVREVEHAIEHPDGTRTELSTNGVPLLDAEGNMAGMVATIEDITDRRLADVTRRRLAAIMESSPDAIIVKAADGTITDWNLGAEEIYGYPRSYAIGRHISFVVPDHRMGELEDVHDRVRAGETIRNLETERVRADGETVWVSLTISPIRADAGTVVGMSALGRDVTEQVTSREELGRYALELERSNHELEQFAYVASHDLQEPLRMVTSFLQLLARRYEGQLDENADQYIGFAVDGATRMRRLIDDLLAYSRVGTRGHPFEPVDLGAVTQKVLADLAEAIEESGGSIVVGDLPVVLGDASQLGQVFLNLIGNALKFHDADSPRIHVHADVSGSECVATVEDHGIGIPTEHTDRIFIIFQRLHGRDEYPGTGMGLAIAKKIVERHGGRIWVEEPDHPGTAIRFTLPLLEGVNDE